MKNMNDIGKNINRTLILIGKIIDDILILVGAGMIVYFIYQISQVFAWLAAGIFLIIFGVLIGIGGKK